MAREEEGVRVDVKDPVFMRIRELAARKGSA